MSEPSPLPFDRDISRRIAQKIRAGMGRCWHNARTALRRCPELTDAVYVEGFAVVNTLAIEHGWCETKDAIIDPTYYANGTPIAYFAGLRFTREQILRTRGYKSLFLQWYAEQDTKEADKAYKDYSAAQNAALQYCKVIMQAD
jgi:hypothetical protein